MCCAGAFVQIKFAGNRGGNKAGRAMKHRAMGAVAIRPRLSVRALWLVAMAYGSAMALTGMWSFHRWQHVFATRAVDEIASLFGVLFAAGCAAWAAFSTRSRARRGWLALMTGLLAWGVGGAIWCYQQLWRQAEETLLHTVADVALLLFPLGAGAALLLLSNRDIGQSKSQLILDGVIVGISLFILSWIAVLSDVVRGGGDSRLWLSMHLLANVAIATIAIMAWARARPAYRPSLGLLSSGIILIALSDSVDDLLVRAGRLSHRQPDRPWPVGRVWIVGSGRAVDDRRIIGRARHGAGSVPRPAVAAVPAVASCGWCRPGASASPNGAGSVSRHGGDPRSCGAGATVRRARREPTAVVRRGQASLPGWADRTGQSGIVPGQARAGGGATAA